MGNLIALYVEDDDSTFFLVKTAIAEARLPVELTRACDGDEALSALARCAGQQKPPDVVLLDLNLPRVSGFEVLAGMHESAELMTVPIYVLSTSAVPRDRERALALGARDFHTKPSTFDGLVHLMRAIFEAHPIPSEGRTHH